MRRIVEEAETYLDYASIFNKTLAEVESSAKFKEGRVSRSESMAASVVKTASDVGCPMIICIVEAGISARHLSKYRPKATILAVCKNERKARQLNCHRGVVAMVSDTDTYSDAIVGKAVDFAKAQGLVVSGDNAVVVREHRDAELTETNSKVMKFAAVP